MKNNFPVGMMFIKASRGLAILSLVIGFAVGIFLLRQWRRELNSARYQSNSKLADKITKLNKSYLNSKDVVTAFHQKFMTAGKAQAEFYKSPEFYNEYSLKVHFVGLKDDLQKFRHNVDILKQWMADDFSAAADIIIDKLQKKISMKSPAVVEKKTEAEPFSLIAELDLESFKKKREILAKSSADLQSLLHGAKEDSRLALNSMANQINFFNAYIEGGALAEGPAEESGRVYVVLRQMQELKKSIQEAVLQDWTFDADYKDTIEFVNQEEAKCIKSADDVQNVVSKYGVHLIICALATIAVFVGILVGTDLLKAIFAIAMKP